MKYIIFLHIFIGFIFAFDGNSYNTKALYLDRVNSKVFSKYETSYNLAYKFVRDKIYPLAYNKKYFAYVIEHDNDPADIFSANFIIQNLVNDKVVYINKFKIDDPSAKYSISKYFRVKGSLIERKLKALGIYKKDISFKHGKLYYRGDSFSLYSKSTKKYYKDFDSNFLIYSKIYIKSAKKGSKVIDKHYYKHPSYILARKPIGFLKLGNNRRVAVIVANVTRGWEGPSTT